jgi:hypothetical protein
MFVIRERLFAHPVYRTNLRRTEFPGQLFPARDFPFLITVRQDFSWKFYTRPVHAEAISLPENDSLLGCDSVYIYTRTHIATCHKTLSPLVEPQIPQSCF